MSINPRSHFPLQCVKFYFSFLDLKNFLLFHSWRCLTKKTSALDCLLFSGECLLTVSFMTAWAVDLGTGFSYSHRNYRAHSLSFSCSQELTGGAQRSDLLGIIL